VLIDVSLRKLELFLDACSRALSVSPFNSPCWYRNGAAFEHGLVRQWKHYAWKYHIPTEHRPLIADWCVQATVFSDFFVYPVTA
jgi:hypothetical protein